MTIEKFTGTFEKEESGCTIMVNETINYIRDCDALGIYAYLLSKSSSWDINAKELMKHFRISKAKVYRVLTYLMDIFLLKRTAIRDGGRFVKFHYKLHLRPYADSVSEENSTPVPKIQELVNRDTYKTKITSSVNKDKRSICGETPHEEEIILVYHEELPNNPKIKIADPKLKQQLKTMVKNWNLITSDGSPFTVESFRRYLQLIKTKFSWFVKPYVTQNGNRRCNSLRNITTQTNIAKIMNGEFNSNAY